MMFLIAYTLATICLLGIAGLLCNMLKRKLEREEKQLILFYLFCLAVVIYCLNYPAPEVIL